MRLPRPAFLRGGTAVSLAWFLATALVLYGAHTAGELRTGQNSRDVLQADRDTVEHALSHLDVIPRRHHVLGYSREQFGGWEERSWTDSTAGTDGADGTVTPPPRCTTRQIVMLQTFRHHSPAPDGDCPTAEGDTVDVYSGTALQPSDVEIDHVVPLSAAWDHGAHSWDRDTRVRFANDVELNLLAVSASTNRAKSDGTPGEWLPETTEAGSPSGAGCAYSARYLTVCVVYGLSVSSADAETTARQCGL